MRMAEAGIFGSRKTELVRGRIKKMAAQNYPHRWAISKITDLLVAVKKPTDWLVIEGTLRLSDDSAPDPDFHLFDVPGGTPEEKLPLPILVIEVSDKTYLKDSVTKLRLYARAGIADYWIVNLPDQRVEVYRKPENLTGKESGWRYASVKHLHAGESVAMLKRPKVKFAVERMLA
jgi:Uma2 family endonuclease